MRKVMEVGSSIIYDLPSQAKGGGRPELQFANSADRVVGRAPWLKFNHFLGKKKMSTLVSAVAEMRCE